MVQDQLRRAGQSWTPDVGSASTGVHGLAAVPAEIKAIPAITMSGTNGTGYPLSFFIGAAPG
ncbi:hypothetical protein OIE62_39185 [Streptomyces scopuliridis]|uniref:Uncharacterized protein n=1 Tax=Streptomyces scopuliridis TaxID=452529 RepID=A0ACD4ZZ95_9ACTN|nr:hypothetical protein [Streptomyces scopuliridis]WSB38974.1 hypothetical protein OG949_01130 [Streptomyces scopuliridis]WSC03422.1 hypothetical protein OG835_01740 [Streptomyces scopuliridis]WSC11282.1 hypothetical protein OIE62_39185 [Streptomyces scopuliridis]